MIKIGYVIDTIESPYAGTEKQLLTLVARLDRSAFEPHLICLRSSPWLESARLPCPVLVLGLQSFLSLDYLRAGRKFVGYCREHGLDMVQSFFVDSNLAATLWAHRARVPVIVASRRNIGSGYWHNWRNVRLLRYLKRYVTCYLANSQAAASEVVTVEGVSPSKTIVIPNALDLKRFQKPDQTELTRIRRRWGFGPGDLVVGAVANLRPVKNLSLLVEAATRVVDKYPQAKFVILGEGDQRESLTLQIAAAGLSDRFALPGRSDSTERDLYALDIAVLCSHKESLSNSLIEYLAAERAVVASDVGGNAEIITDPALGLLFPAGDASALTDRISSLIDNPDGRRSLGAAGRVSVEKRYSEAAIIARYEETYRTLAAGRGACCG